MKILPADNQHDIACKLAKEYSTASDLNEADTRHQVIDVLLHRVLAWPEAATLCEPFIDPGYADYVLVGKQEKMLFFLEAKKIGDYFTLPAEFDPKVTHSIVRLSALLTTPAISDAIQQVRRYCLEEGCEYAGVTNGNQWILFKVFEKQSKWTKLNAFVIHSLAFFCKDYAEATNSLSYGAIVEGASLPRLLGTAFPIHRELYHPKTKIASYNQEVRSNHLAPIIRPLAERYLGRMDEHDDAFMDSCYVNRREYEDTYRGVNRVIHDCLSPYFVNYNVQDFFDDGAGGAFGNRIASSARDRRTQDVIVLFGGKGSGKSTFIRKLLFHRPPNPIKHFSVVAVVDLLKCEEDTNRINNELWKQLLSALDKDKVLQGTREQLIQLFADRYDRARRQTLVGLDPESEAYNTRLNEQVQSWLADSEYCAQQLADYWKRRQKGLIVVLDNTDQFSPKTQDYCFTLAHHLSSILDCLVVISMREERFHYSKIHGTLDAFQNSGFHLSSPPPQLVFYRRLRYILEMLDDPLHAAKIVPGINAADIQNLKALLRVLLREFRRLNSHLNQFLRACAHGDMRLALDFFKEFLLSGYTKVDEMISIPGWQLQVHQVLRPMMVPYRFFYDESMSSIPNVYQIRSQTTGSHFTAMRILSILSDNMSPSNPAFIPLSNLKSYFASTFNMVDDLEKHLDLLLKKGIVESNNRLDEYDESIDSLRISAHGHYLVNTLARQFNYIDLVCLDTAIHDPGVANGLACLADRDIDLYFAGQKRLRVDVRIERTQLFVDYLVQEEEAERDIYSLDAREIRFGKLLKERFEEEKIKILQSADRNYGKPTGFTTTLGDYWD